MIVEKMTDLIGNTPLLKIPSEMTGLKNIELYGKLEMMNPYGSVKDRVAWAMIKDDLADIKDKGQKVFENSSGNTAKALAAITAAHGIPFKMVSAIAKVREPKDMLRLLGAEIEEFASASDCFDPSDPNDPQFLIEKAVRESGGKVYFTSQFTNEKNPAAHEATTAVEILDDLGSVDYLVSGLGTTGSTLGLLRGFKKANPNFKAVALVSKGGQMIPGIRSLDQMWESGLYQEGSYEHHCVVSEKEALQAMLDLNRSMGLLCGPSAGANYAGACAFLKTIDEKAAPGTKAVFIVCDRVEWYLTYIRERMPELFGEQHKPDSLFNFDLETVGGAPELPAKNVEEWISSNHPTVIDTRSPLAYKLSHLPGALNIPVEMLGRMIDGADPFPKDRPVLLICAVGEKTRLHAGYLKSRGFDAYSLEGGMLGWKQAQIEGQKQAA